MGRDKASLLYRGRPLALYQADKLRGVCDGVALVGKGKSPFPKSGVPFVDDSNASYAAIFGVEAALATRQEEWNLVLAVDIPRCRVPFLEALVEKARAADALVVAPRVAGEIQTLCSVWRLSSLPVLREAIGRGDLSLKALIERRGGVVLTEAETAKMPGGEPGNFLNVNRPEDYEELAKDTSADPS
jgi:molybdopterin-guanine dinucleotide biosynthesis protein A